MRPRRTGPASDDESSGLPVSGTLRYDLRYSQTAQFGGDQDGQQRIFASGDASYTNTGKRLPFSMQYGGGYGWAWAGPPSAGKCLSASVALARHGWAHVEPHGQRQCQLYF